MSLLIIVAGHRKRGAGGLPGTPVPLRACPEPGCCRWDGRNAAEPSVRHRRPRNTRGSASPAGPGHKDDFPFFFSFGVFGFFFLNSSQFWVEVPVLFPTATPCDIFLFASSKLADRVISCVFLAEVLSRGSWTRQEKMLLLPPCLKKSLLPGRGSCVGGGPISQLDGAAPSRPPRRLRAEREPRRLIVTIGKATLAGRAAGGM